MAYQIAVRAKQGQPIFNLESGPEGMKVSPSGLVTWHCPAECTGKNAAVIISIKEVNGQQIYHNFSLAIE